MDRLTALFHSYTGRDAEECVALSPSGSRRRYFRLSAGDVSLIGVHGTDLDENLAFIALSGHFRSKGLRVPEVLTVSDDGMYYLQQDLGDVLLYDTLADARRTGDYGPAERALLLRAVSELPAIQVEGARGLDFSVCYPSDAFNARMVDFDLNYFKYCFLKPTSVEFNEEMLQDDFERLKEDLLQDVPDAFMYRDFQARNIMLHDGELWYIDFQGGRRGPLEYDLASFAWQARARYPEDLRRALVDTYMDALGKYMSVDKEAFRERLRTFVLFRTLQVLGAYGFRGRIEKRSHFLESIPYALENLRELVSTPFERYPYLSAILEKLVRTGPGLPQQPDGLLHVHIYSFSYKKGIPEDLSGNGGGYVFDCRSVHNPGKYERFRTMTGLDREVQDFLEEDGEIITFLGHVFPLVDAHVERFVSRGFTHLQVSFGCTGGQHRSAYSAQKLAEHLAGRPGVRVHLHHRELGIERTL